MIIIISWIVLFHQIQGNLFIHDPPISYTIVNRYRRDHTPWIYPEIEKNQVSCGPNVYMKLFTCSKLTQCRELSTCLESVHCPLEVKSFAALIVNLLRVLGINTCHIDDRNQLCPNEKRLIILKELFTYWTKINDDAYCSTITSFMTKVKSEIDEQCPLKSRQVDAFLENYFCSKNSTKSSPIFFSQIAYIDEDDDLKFINANKNLFNNTEQDVYVNDHQYYNVSYIVPKSIQMPSNYVEDNHQFVRIHALSNRHRSAFSMNLKFGFPFYGHIINKILVATGGFIYTGDLLHSALIGSTQYIAPFMANFDASIGNNETEIKYFDNGTHFVCTWKKIYLQDQHEAGPFTFQAILQNTGNIYFNYVEIPTMKISNANHAHRLGLSDAYLSQHATNEHIVRVITLYNKINLDKEKIKNGLSIVFDMDQTCNTFKDCSSCLANRGRRYNCSWCGDIDKCSDGFDRSRQQWLRAQCHRLSSDQICPNSLEDTFDTDRFPSSSPLPFVAHFEKRKTSSRTNSAFQIFRTTLITLLISVLVLSLLTLTGTYFYAYRHPTSPAGMWLIEHRPSAYLARFRHFTGLN